jgi:hypothetical protein
VTRPRLNERKLRLITADRCNAETSTFIQAVQVLTTPAQYVYEEHLRHEAKKFFLHDRHWHVARAGKIGPARREIVLHLLASPMSSV